MGDSGPTRRWSSFDLARLVSAWVVLLVGTAGLAAGCGQSDPGQPDDVLSGFTQRCVGATKSLESALISFDAAPAMRLNETSDFTVAVTPPDQPVDDLPGQDEVLVTCSIDARLVMSPADASVTPTGWETRVYVPPEPAEWSWLVTPVSAGVIDANIEIRPVVVVEGDGGQERVAYATKRYDVDISVREGVWDRVNALITPLRAIIGLLTAAVALAVALGARRWGPELWGRVRRRSPDRPAPEGDPTRRRGGDG